MVLVDEGNHQTTAIFPKPKQVLPVNLDEKHPHGKFDLITVFEAMYEPLQVVFPVKQVLGVQMCCKPNPI